MTINDIVKETIRNLNAKRTILTPDNYLKTFCQIAQKNGFSIQECHKKEKFIKKLNDTMREDIGKYNVNSLDELLTYLVSSLNRLTLGNSGKQKLVTMTLIKQLLRLLSRSGDQKIRELANASLERIEYLADFNSFEIIAQKWEEILDNESNDYMLRLQRISGSNSHDISQILDSIEALLDNSKTEETLNTMASIIISSLTPSLTQTLDDEISTIGYTLKNQPQRLGEKKFQDTLKVLIEKRIKIDKEEVKQRVLSLDEILSDVSVKILRLMDNSNISNQKVKEIKKELSQVDEESIDFEVIKSKLLKIANSLEIETKELSEIMQKEDTLVGQMQVKIKKLEKALQIAKKESKLDFLTGLVSKRGLDEEMHRADKRFRRYQIEYSVAFFDIDHFKSINDTYGHEAGDLVLKQLGKLLLNLKRDVDIIGRYGGEEFLALLPNTPLEGAQIFAEKVRTQVENFVFKYKGEKVPVTISAGVSNAQSFDTQKEVIEEADSMLYRAKQNGRNRVYPPLKVMA